jgi:YggT family protein
MSSLSCWIATVLVVVLRIFWFAMLLYAVVSWVPSLQGRWSNYLARIVEPVLAPVRRIVPPIGGFDLAFLIVIILVGWVINAIAAAAYCAPSFS